MFGDKHGFILQDALISIMMVSAAVLIVLMCQQAIVGVQGTLRNHRRIIQDEILLSLGQIEECEEKCLEEVPEPSIEDMDS